MHTADRVVLARLPSGLRVETTVHRYGTGASIDLDTDPDPDADTDADADTDTDGDDPSTAAVTDSLADAEGPTLYVQAAQHGREINGTDVCRRLHDRLVGDGTAGPDLDGTVVVVPVADPLTFDRVSYTTPESLDSVNANMNRVWPGDPDGTVHERMAARLWPYAAAADACLDLHTGGLATAVHTVYLRGDEAARRLAEAFGVRLLMGEAAGEDADEEWHDRDFSGKFRVAATRAGIPTITPELAHNKQLVEPAIEAGVDGVVDVCRHLDVLPGDPAPPRQPGDVPPGPLDGAGDGHDGASERPTADGDWGPGPYTYARNHLGRVRATDSGLFVVDDGVEVGGTVAEGQRLGAVYDPTTYERRQVATADRDGLCYSVVREATVRAGETLVGVAEPLPAEER
jgi:predicted deacylase